MDNDVDTDLSAPFRKMNKQFEQLSSRLAEAYANVPEDEGMAEIDAAVSRERHGS